MYKGKRKYIEIWQKVEIAEFYIQHQNEMSMRDVAAKFHVNSFSSISEWVNKLDELKKSVKSDKKLKLESFTQFPELEKELVHWFTAIREQGIQVLRSTIEEKAKSLAAEWDWRDSAVEINGGKDLGPEIIYLSEKSMPQALSQSKKRQNLSGNT
ncbi:unnamed protein product [Blepharisma stoltei]|uniref:HTH CENPB-type domain-containing protein n=1 Tax=Blepharisma stoltei TaxID=1481888 RepID=A0AAU9J6Z1_9CILI|nr:unnamed protein product [Blepharisma stoltei]